MLHRSLPIQLTMLLAGLVAVSVFWWVLLTDMDDRARRERADGERQLQNMAQLSAMELKSRFELIDLTLRDMRALWLRDSIRYEEVISQQAAALDPGHPPKITILENTEIDPEDRITIHPPRADLQRQVWVVDFTRPLRNQLGQPMRGKIRLSMDADQLTRSFPAMYKGAGSAMTLLRDDDTVIFRLIEPADSSSVPAGAATANVPALKYPAPPGLRNAPQGLGQAESRISMQQRTFAWWRVERFPATLLLSVPTTLLYRDFSLYRTRYLAGGALASVILLLGAYGLGQWIATRERARRQLQHNLRRLRRGNERLIQSREALRRLSAHQTEVREQERKRIAAEVHDDLGQRLTVLRMDIALLPRSLPADLRRGLESPISHLLEGLDQVMARVRNLARQLRPPGLDIGLASAVESLVEEFETGLGIAIELKMDLPAQPAIDEHQATAIYRMLQEALTNVARHARARHVNITLGTSPGGLRLRVQDDGQGFSSPATEQGFGLSSLRERAHSLGGQCTIRSTPHEGTVVEAVLPLLPPPPVPEPAAPAAPAIAKIKENTNASH